jgi:TPP-dependent pyruvate/acetoin dehydrogenase alpha subunit
MGLRRGLELSENRSRSFNIALAIDTSLATLREMYVTLVRIRKFEERVAELVSKEEIVCPCHLYIGEEVMATGVCSALRKDDYVFQCILKNINSSGEN